jgi:hypothetical protein
LCVGDRLSMSKFFISVWEIDLVCRNPSLSPFEMVFYLCANGHVTLSFLSFKTISISETLQTITPWLHFNGQKDNVTCPFAHK